MHHNYILPRLLEGELFTYKGVVWVVKGFQHPPGHIIAYPRYIVNSIPFRKVAANTELPSIFWNCLKMRVPVIPLNRSYFLQTRPDYTTREIMRLFIDAGISEDYIYVTGSRALPLIYTANDIDLVIYGEKNCEKAYRLLLDLRADGVTRALQGMDLIKEYMSKHKDIQLSDYEFLRKNSVLQGVYKGVRYSIRLVPYEKGVNECIDEVNDFIEYKGLVEIVRVIRSYTTPAYYEVRLLNTDKTVLMATYRLRYTELEKGIAAYVYGRLETHNDKEVLVPDHGVLKPVAITNDSGSLLH
ncbi:MAG: hypothetical protein DRO40_01050 [Thermoprotei archaeon]|nr:MAG: hypothetical protein DRO40_01050 [Thermoprotei archaeon]